MAREPKLPDERDRVVERLREFVRFSYITASEIARQMGVTDKAFFLWLSGETRPRNPERITAFLDSMPAESGGGIAPTGYQYRDYENRRGIPKPRRCPFCKQVKGEIRKVRGGFQGFCPGCAATGPKRESDDEALRAWNGKSK